MSSYQKLGIGHEIHALRIRVMGLEHQLAALREDVRRLLSLLEPQRAGAQVICEPDVASAETEPDARI